MKDEIEIAKTKPKINNIAILGNKKVICPHVGNVMPKERFGGICLAQYFLH